MRWWGLAVLALALLAACRDESAGGGKTPPPSATVEVPPTSPAATATVTATAPAESRLWEGDRVSISLPGGCTTLLSLPRFDGLAKAVAQVCSGREATLLASGHYVDGQYLWRRLDFGSGVSGWLVDLPLSGAGPRVVTLISAGPGPSDGPYFASGTAVMLYPPTPECLTVRSFPSNHPDYAQVIGQVCEVKPAKIAADIRYRDEGLYWRRVELDGPGALPVGWVTDGAIAGSRPRSVYDPAIEPHPTPTPTPQPVTPTPTVSRATATPTGEAPFVKQLDVRVSGYVDMDDRYVLEFQYELNKPSDGRWLLIVESFDYCTDGAGAKLGTFDGAGAVASQFAPGGYAGLILTGDRGLLWGEFGAAFLVPNPSAPPPLPIRCTYVRVSLAHFSQHLWDDPLIRLTRDMADDVDTFELAAETWEWGLGGYTNTIHWKECPTCTGW